MSIHGKGEGLSPATRLAMRTARAHLLDLGVLSDQVLQPAEGMNNLLAVHRQGLTMLNTIPQAPPAGHSPRNR
jgi:hypothetical protein